MKNEAESASYIIFKRAKIVTFDFNGPLTMWALHNEYWVAKQIVISAIMFYGNRNFVIARHWADYIF